MKSILTFLVSVTFVCLLGSLLLSCDKWELPTRKTQRNCVKPAGNLTTQIQERKVDFSITNSLGTIDKVIWDFGGTGPNSTTVTTGLTASYTYPTSTTFSAKATLSNSCGNETTLIISGSASEPVKPTVSIQSAMGVLPDSAILGMTVITTGNAPIMQYGICYSSTSLVPDLTQSDVLKSANSGPVNPATSASFVLTNLQPNTLYHARSFAINKVGPGYSTTVQDFKTGSKPAISIVNPPTVSVTTSKVSFVVQNEGDPSAIEYGICYSSTNNMPSITNSSVTPASNVIKGVTSLVTLSSLTPNTRYYYRAYARLSTTFAIYSSYNASESFVTQIDPLTQDLIASVSFTDGSRSDVSGNNNNVIPVGNPTFTADHNGKANSAIQLNGLGDYFYMAENSNGSLRPDAFSISIWIKPISLNLDPDGWMQIYNKSRFSDGAYEMYSALIRPTSKGSTGITINTDIKQNSNCQSGAWQTLTVGTGIDLNKWYHIVFTYNGGQIGKMYINGLLLFTKSDFSSIGMDKCPGGELKFGAQGKSDTNYFYGAMDDIRMYRRVLTDSEVQTLFNQ